jgi:hypothetical protein
VSLIDSLVSNLLSPMILFFFLGFAAASARSDLSIPESVAKALAIYLMLAIGFKGGVAVNAHGLEGSLVATLAIAAVLSFVLPFAAFALLRAATGTPPLDAAAVAAHYGSISIVTFVTATEFLKGLDVVYEGYLVAAAAVMETPAIISGLWLAARHMGDGNAGPSHGRNLLSGQLAREIFLNGSVVMLVGAFLIGVLTGETGMTDIRAFVEVPFKGVLCLFLLDMGLVAAHRLKQGGIPGLRLVAFAIYMPLIGAAAGVVGGLLAGLGTGGITLLAVLSASASYIAVPAAMRLALPQANPALYLTLSLAITFPFNVAVGIPIYFAAARWVAGG